MENLRIEEKPRGHAVAVILRGELDLGSAEEVGARLTELREAGQPVILDLDELDFMDSCGLRAVLQAAEASAESGWEFRVTRGSPEVSQVFEATGVLDRLPLAEDRG